MSSPNPVTLLIRAAWVIVLIVALLFGSRIWKNHQRRDAIVAEMKSIATESSYFHQFNAQDARKTLLRAIGLMHEAARLDLPHEELIDLAFGFKSELFEADDSGEEYSSTQTLIRQNLILNYVNFTKLGYTGDMRTINAFKNGEIPHITSGTFQGKRAEIRPIIDPALSPGMEKILPNLHLAPTQETNTPHTDLEVANAKRLARDLALAGVIEDPVRDRIIQALSEDSKLDKAKE
jgi:hypothetical protein